MFIVTNLLKEFVKLEFDLETWLSVKIFDLFRSVVGKPQLIFLSLIDNFILVSSVVSNIFKPYVASQLTPFKLSQCEIRDRHMVKLNNLDKGITGNI